MSRIRERLSLLACFWMATGIASAQEPVLGDYFAHDPSTMIKEGNRYYIFYTGFAIPYKYSTDLRNWTWTSSQRIFPAGPPAWVTNAVPGFDQNYWAPDVAYFNGKYHVYYSVSRWGTIDSAIGLVTSPSLITPVWIDQGKVVQSDAVWEAGPDTDTTSFNCIDPSILLDTNGTIWMVYGSYSDGILVTQIDPATGKRLNPASIGTKIASSSTSFFNNTTEGAHIHQRGGYYWLFLNYGGCCSGIDSTYNIRVGRSTSVTGPYLDKNGVNMLSGGGTMLLESTGRFVGPGHAGIFIENGTNWFTYHYYDANNNAEVGRATLGLTQIQWAEDGWPALTNHWSAFYPFEADAREHRRQFDGVFRNGASIANDTDRGGVLQLDGASQYVDLRTGVANASTFAAWVKWNGGGSWQRIFDFGNGTSRYLFLTPSANDGRLRFAITTNGGGAEQRIIGPSALPIGSWTHVAVTLDGSRGLLFVNGAPVATNPSVNIRPWQVMARSNYVGRSQWPDPLFNGQIDSLRIFGRALAPAEIRDLAYAHPGLAHRYSFASNAWDSIGMAHGKLRGNAAVTNNALKLTGTAGGYVDLPGGLVSGSSAVTLEFWASFGPNGNWSRVFDFGNISGNVGQNFYFFSPHTPTPGLRLGLSTSSTSNFDVPGAFDNQTLHVVCITDPTTGYSAIYTNGVLRASQTSALPPLSGVSTAWSFLGRSLFAADAWLNATIDEFRIYHGRLTPDEITANYIAGPDALAIPIQLTVSNSPSGLTLRWPAYGVGFRPESSPLLSPNAIWSPAGGTPALDGNFYRVTLPTAGTNEFFRLKR